MSSRHKILIIDKNDKYPFLFKGFRKNKFFIDHFKSFSKLSDRELSDFNLFFMVMYETKDVFELLKVYKGTIPVVVASDNLRILKKMKNLGCFPLLDLSKKENVNIGLYNCIEQVFL